jgi:hypothetical protein
MESRVLIGLVFALACAASAGLGGLWTQKGAVDARAVDIRHPWHTAVAVIASTTSAANLFGILGGVVVFGDPLGRGAPTIIGRLVAFGLVPVAVGVMPAPVRAHEASRAATRTRRRSEAIARSVTERP